MSTFDSEAAVIGACLLVPEAYWSIADLLTREDFSRPELGAIWAAIGDLIREGPVDAVTFGERCPQYAARAAELASETPGASNVRAYAELVQRAAVTRRVRASGERIAKLAGEDALGEAQRILATCAPKASSAIKPAREFFRESMDRMMQRHAATEILTGIPTSIERLDEMLSGWQRGDLILIGARPSVGKTALAVQASVHAAIHGHPVLFLSLEMTGSQLTDRILSHLARVDGQFIRQPKRIEEADWPKITRASEAIAKLPLRIDETSALTVEGACARIRQANARERLGLVVIDYLTQMTPPKAEKLTDGIQIITRQLKALAKDLAVSVILLSQLNRAGDGKPTLTSLRESGAIEQDADVVLLLHRPQEAKPDLIECIVAKQRNGPVGDCWLQFERPIQHFTPTLERPEHAVTRRRGFRAVPDPYWDAA